jgi:hypothetical protein
LSAGKKLIDTNHPAYKAVTAIRGKVQSYWKSLSLPYPEPGVRLIRQDKIDEFAAKMREFQEELSGSLCVQHANIPHQVDPGTSFLVAAMLVI